MGAESCEKSLQTLTFFATFCSHKKRCNIVFFHTDAGFLPAGRFLPATRLLLKPPANLPHKLLLLLFLQLLQPQPRLEACMVILRQVVGAGGLVPEEPLAALFPKNDSFRSAVRHSECAALSSPSQGMISAAIHLCPPGIQRLPLLDPRIEQPHLHRLSALFL